jgi:hypothetical protein
MSTPRLPKLIWLVALGFLLTMYAAAGAGLPTVMFLIEEKNLGTIPTAEVEAMGAKMLLQRNVVVVDREMVRANLERDRKSLKAAGDARGAAALGRQFGADVVISGTVVAKPAADRIEDSKLRAYQGVVTIRAVDASTSRTLATASKESKVLDVDDASGGSKALKVAGEQALSVLIPDMLSAWRKYGSSSAPGAGVVLTFGGVDQMWKLKAIRELLKGRGDLVNDITKSSYSAGAAVFKVDAAVPSDVLAEKLVLSAPRGLKFQVLDIGEARINLKTVESR